jgi:hypothetical protein
MIPDQRLKTEPVPGASLVATIALQEASASPEGLSKPATGRISIMVGLMSIPDRIKNALLWLIALTLLLGLLVLFLIGPVAILWETYDILRMRGTSPATVETVRIVKSRQIAGKPSMTRPVVRFSYRINGAAYESKRYLPGFWANHGGWTGGGRAARRFKPGQRVLIHYDPDNPQIACLEYGWFNWSVGLTLAIWGHVVFFALSRILGSAMAVSGVACLFLAPNVLRVRELHWYLLAFAVIVVFFAAYQIWNSRSRTSPARGADA